tara:strand:- start:38886 stop:39023 length:138 start_codon:yes stop_codon:yes gene_type:complete
MQAAAREKPSRGGHFLADFSHLSVLIANFCQIGRMAQNELTKYHK